MSALMVEQDKNEGVQLAVPGLGERLKAARMACNLDMARLAARIHLTTDVVDALERDDYAEMPARVFVRGYVRNYARAVNLPIDSVLAQFDRLWPEEEEKVEEGESPRLAADIHPRKRWPGLISWVILLAVVGLALAWWQGYLDGQPQRRQATSPEVVPETPPAVDKVTPPTPSEGALAPLPQPAPSTPTVVSPTSVGGLPPPLTPAEAEPKPSAEAVDATAATPTALGQPAAEASPPLAESKPPALTEPPVAAAPPKITVRFKRESWVDIRDSTRTFKLVGILKAGTEKVLGGKPPYTVVLGNARAVELRIDDKPFDLQRYSRGNVARFTLNP